MTTNRQNSRRNNFSYDFRARKKPISKVIKGLPVDYKDVEVLLSYISDRAKISSSYRTGNAAKDHRSLTKAIKRARHMALLPISHEHDIVRTSIEETSNEEPVVDEATTEQLSSNEESDAENKSEESDAENKSEES
tara:strand:+ start:5129 stop:5536 length:408 start_codon:yes stop_codon:yes gene_type:complete